MNGGKSTTDKNTVIKGITWELTGTRNEQYVSLAPPSPLPCPR